MKSITRKEERLKGQIVSVFGNMVMAETAGRIVKNAIAYCNRFDGARLLGEVIRVRGNMADLQIFEETRGLRVGDSVDFEDKMVSAILGPGLLGQIYDGLQNPLPRYAEKAGYFLEPGIYLSPLDTERKWQWTPAVKPGATVFAGDTLGTVPESIFKHPIMVPFTIPGELKVEWILEPGDYTIRETIAKLGNHEGHKVDVQMQQEWPVKRPLSIAAQRLMPSDPLVTRIRIIDSLYPVSLGGTYCIPGPFGAGKTVLQQITSRHAEIDIVVFTACGERAGEIVETIRDFPKLSDPRTGRSLMERTIIICNTSAMPVAAREASVYTGITLAEYYRQAGLNVLLLADSTSRWAQAMREISGRLEEIPGEEAFPAYLESRIAGFYERAGAVELRSKKKASVTIGGTVSPAGGNFDEPVTQATLKIVGAFHALSRERSDARRYPAIDPLESWSKYAGIIEPMKIRRIHKLLQQGDKIRQMMTVVGEEGTTIEDFTLMLKSEFVDTAYLQQNAFDDVDGATPRERQKFVLDKVLEVINLDFAFREKDEARTTMVKIGNLFKDLNYAPGDPGAAGFYGRRSEKEHRKSESKETPDEKPQNDRNNNQDTTKRKSHSSDRGNFADILKKINFFIRSKGKIEAGKEDMEDTDLPSSHRLEKIKTMKADTRPRSRQTLLGRSEDEENNQESDQ
jgi:V/A-type H+/Na+-transporting ATPase subunit A